MSDPRLTEPVEKSERGYQHVQQRCVRPRESGDLPYYWISDSSRRGYFTQTYSNASEFLRSGRRSVASRVRGSSMPA